MEDHKQKQMPPEGRVMQLLSGRWIAPAIGCACKLGLADHLVDGPRTVEDLARETGTDPVALGRLLRALASVGVFRKEDGGFDLTPMAEVLRTDREGSLAPLAIFFSSTPAWRPIEALEHSVRTGESAFSKVFGREVFDWFADHPDEARIFDEAMTSNSTRAARAVLTSYDFSDIGTLVDVGGGEGHLLLEILEAFPHLDGILFDLPQVIDRVRDPLDTHERVRPVAGDFFETVPEADACILKHIVHDWDDERAAKILENCREAVSGRGPVLVVEGIIKPGNAPQFTKLLDLEMLIMTPGGRERTREQFEMLFKKAGLDLHAVHPIPGGLSIIEGR